ncbi:shikimate dehydrogenase family protein [Achromobacter xylosoxidans]|uniref:shikimate dehydrogenase family protein n=1 Tax=Alcaligenes xylosoxydans xylosoxydans TaxID=85698 RepID=UPI001F141237
MEITGSTTVFAIAADPIAHVKTPQRLNALLRERGIDAVMVPFHVAAAGLPGLFAGLRGLANLGGLVVTVPHKETAATLCDALTPAAELIGAVNAVRLRDGCLTGGNFDGLGFVAGLRGQGHEPAGRHVYLAGLGGAGKAIACAIAEAGPASLRLYNRSPGKAEAFAARLARHYPGLAISVADPRPEACDIAINATTLGLDDNDPLPFQLDALAPGAVVADAVMSRVDTPLLRAAAARGCRTHPGLYMLEGQLTEIARFLGIEKPQQELLNALA